MIEFMCGTLIFILAVINWIIDIRPEKDEEKRKLKIDATITRILMALTMIGHAIKK